MSSWTSFPKIFNFGHKLVQNIFDGTVIMEEKIDGSQVSFGKINGELRIRSKGAELSVEFPEKMFRKAVTYIKSIEHLLHPEWTYRGEYLAKPKHNTLAYNRAPNNYIIIFDINTEEETYLTYGDKVVEAGNIGLECVPLLGINQGACKINGPEDILKLLQEESVLGGQKIEGVVLKNYDQFGPDKKVLMAKYVSEAFKEVHGATWKESNPSSTDLLSTLVGKYKTPARWNKAVQHLRESGTLTDSPRDIGGILKEVQLDLVSECEDEIKQDLFKYFIPKLQRGVICGVAEWYKEELLKLQFNKENNNE